MIDDLRRHKHLIKSQADLYQFEEMKRLKADIDAKFKRDRETEELKKLGDIQDWLTAANTLEDQEAISNRRVGYPGVCGWILDHPTFKSWQTDSSNAKPVLWITGIPGSGKFGKNCCNVYSFELKNSRKINFDLLHHRRITKLLPTSSSFLL